MNKAAIGKKLTALRENRPREEIALSVGISSSALGMYEQGNRVPRDEIKIRLASYYSTSVQALFFDN